MLSFTPTKFLLRLAMKSTKARVFAVPGIRLSLMAMMMTGVRATH